MTLKVARIHLSPLRHSSESWNPVVYVIHSRLGGNDNEGDIRVGKGEADGTEFHFTPRPRPRPLDSGFRLPATSRRKRNMNTS